MPEPRTPQRRTTLIGKKIKQHLNQSVTVFLDNGVAMNGVLLDYFYDPVEKDGCIILSNDKGDEPPVIFRRYVTTIQPRRTTAAKKKAP